MRAGDPSRDSPTMKLVAAELRERPGVTAAQFGDARGWSPSHTSSCLSMAKHYGLAGYVRSKSGVHWYPAEALEAAKLAAAAERRSRGSRAYVLRAKGIKAWHLRELTDRPVQRVGASGPLPFEVKAARSVFDLAGAL